MVGNINSWLLLWRQILKARDDDAIEGEGADLGPERVEEVLRFPPAIPSVWLGGKFTRVSREDVMLAHILAPPSVPMAAPGPIKSEHVGCQEDHDDKEGARPSKGVEVEEEGTKRCQGTFQTLREG